ncbi:hypothetical protein G6O67_006566 [Ophiocordyceps sinensis]|uniref:Helitron helicase-like domain-containing protein n=1 Tax=Ophiocordyceps sinensis TaxID=72228 RepID=A0A8H4PP69_9HYPO|nr:hypothetical protein G6O67_006566 [Ophiocordyceps sinensis]
MFLTNSAADLHWHRLQRFMPRFDEWLRAEHQSKFAIAGVNLRNNPHIAAYHFHQRYTSFLKRVKFGVTDYWFRCAKRSRAVE